MKSRNLSFQKYHLSDLLGYSLVGAACSHDPTYFEATPIYPAEF